MIHGVKKYLLGTLRKIFEAKCQQIFEVQWGKYMMTTCRENILIQICKENVIDFKNMLSFLEVLDPYPQVTEFEENFNLKFGPLGFDALCVPLNNVDIYNYISTTATTPRRTTQSCQLKK